MKVPVKLGVSRAGEEKIDLPDLPHMLVPGYTRSGKSNFLHTILIQLIRNPNVRLYIIDMKRLEFEMYKEHAWVAHEIDDVATLVDSLYNEMNLRMDFLAEVGVSKIQEFDQGKYEGNIPYLVLIIDEFMQLSPKLEVDKKLQGFKAFIYSQLTHILAMAAALGIQVVIATQRPDKDVVQGPLKVNIPTTMCFRVRGKVNSDICLDNHLAAELPPIRGRAIWQIGDTDREIQTYKLSIRVARDILQSVTPRTRPENAPKLEEVESNDGEEDHIGTE